MLSFSRDQTRYGNGTDEAAPVSPSVSLLLHAFNTATGKLQSEKAPSAFFSTEVSADKLAK